MSKRKKENKNVEERRNDKTDQEPKENVETKTGAAEILKNYINGKFVDPEDGLYLDDVNPATNEVIAKIPRSNDKDVQSAVTAALAAQDKWAATSFTERAQYLDAIASEIERRQEELAGMESRDAGKTLSQCRMIDIPRAISNFRFFAGAIRHTSTECHEMADAINYTHRTPVGVAGLITPWNLPLYLLSWKVAPALAMGNVVIAKPSEITPLTASALAEIIHAVKLPAGVFQLVHGLGSEAGQAIVSHDAIRLISFTGGTVTGQRVAATAAPMFKKLSLELGGKNATIVFADCDFNDTVNGAVRAAFTNQGQVCLSGSRLFVEHSLYDTFLAAFVKKVAEYKCGDPNTSNFGCLSSLAHRDKVESYIELAKKEGGTILCGGARPTLSAPFDKGAFIEPTVISGLSPSSRCATEEIFGPVVTVHPFATEEEVLKYANGVRYGLAGSLWTNNLKRAHRVAQRWKTGMVWVNCWLHRDLRVPFGGVKDSGSEREGGRWSLEFYSDSKNICVKY